MRRAGSRELGLLAASASAAILSAALPWSTVEAACANTDVTRRFFDLPAAAWFFLFGLAAAGASHLLAGRAWPAAATVGLIAAAVALALAATAALEPFEAVRPAAAGEPGAVLCGLNPGPGLGFASLALVLATAAGCVRLLRSVRTSGREAVGAVQP